jgi:hypothetical protein
MPEFDTLDLDLDLTDPTYEEFLEAELDAIEAHVSAQLWAERHPSLVRRAIFG